MFAGIGAKPALKSPDQRRASAGHGIAVPLKGYIVASAFVFGND